MEVVLKNGVSVLNRERVLHHCPIDGTPRFIELHPWQHYMKKRVDSKKPRWWCPGCGYLTDDYISVLIGMYTLGTYHEL